MDLLVHGGTTEVLSRPAPFHLFYLPQLLSLCQHQMFYFEMPQIRRDDHGLHTITALRLTCEGLRNLSFLLKRRISSWGEHGTPLHL